MAPMTNRVKVSKYFWGLFKATNNFAFDLKVILGSESTHPDVGTKSRDERTNERKKSYVEVAHHLKIHECSENRVIY